MPNIVAQPPIEVLTPLERLRQEEIRLRDALHQKMAAEAEARLAVYNICSQELWRAEKARDGRQLFQTKEEYFNTRWAASMSRTLFFAYVSTLERLAWMGFDPAQIVQESPSHNFDHSVTLLIGQRWDYKKQALAEPDEGLNRLLGNGEPFQEGLQRIYLESVEEAKELGPGEALRSLELALGKPLINFTQEPSKDFVLRIDVEQYKDNDGHPMLTRECYYLRSDEPLPEEVTRLLRKRLWFKEVKEEDKC